MTVGRRSPRRIVAAVAAAVLLASCGSDASTSDDGDIDTGLAGVVRDPAPDVSGTSLPSLTDPGTDIEFVAPDGGVQVVYFGFTNCPDVCPTTLADYRAALNRLERDEPGITDRIETVVVTVDPERDLDTMAEYAAAFVPDAEAAGTLDLQRLRAAGEPFGASWDVRTLDDGTVEVDHSPFLYAVDDEGELLISWLFGTSPTDIRSDLETLLERAEA